ncbi:extracellular solute-binding protein [Rhizobium miluonense]|uniref:Putative spermidine/putrescine transport system substrate-binding protein n=1 Tax=Rhizobium miluonense TaxID=411945 RepID=A0A1C3WDH7_9HYPH|nr:extracellular solute-binding protein [Rhizobium miluonense]SCB37888.1 putative spermidine/putrescine transport system substrate-binding protein [Rhizobium miluonense]
MKRGTLFTYIASAVVGLGLFAGAASAQTVVTLGGYGELFADQYKKAVVDAFNASQTEVKVEYYAIGGSAQILGTLRAQKAAPQVDAVIMDIGVAKAGTDEGLFDKVDESVSKHVADLYPQARLDGVAGVGFTLDNVVLLYDKEKVTPAPDTWEALWGKGLERKVAIPAPPEILGMSLTVIAEKMAGGGDFVTSTQKAITKLGLLSGNVLTFEPKPDPYTPIMSKQALLSVGWNARAQYFSAQPGSNLGAVLPKEGSVFQVNSLNLVKGAKNTEAAKKFIDYALGPEAQAAFAKAMFYAPANSKVELPDEVASRTAAKSMDRMLPMNPLEAAKVRDRILQEWRRGVISR